MANERVERVSEAGEPEAWAWEIDDDFRGVEALHVDEGAPWPWQVGVTMAEFVREEPLESEMCAAIEAALRSVPGVVDVVREDTEVWIVEGAPSGEAMVRAVGAALEPLVERAEALVDAME